MLVAVNEYGRRIGESHPRCKLTDIQVDTIRELHETGLIGYKKLAEVFNVAKSTIQDIVICRRRYQTPVKFKRV